MEDVKKILEKHMAEYNLKRYELANRLGTTPANITNWLSGKHKISPAWRRIIKEELRLK